MSDAAQYHFIAANVADGKGFVDYFPQLELHPTAFRPPGYPFLLAAAYRVFGDYPGLARLINILIGTAVVVVLFVVLDRCIGRRAATAGALASALLPNFIANDTYVLTESLSLLLLLLLIWSILSKRSVTAGVVTGLLVLTRPSAQYLALLLALYLLSKYDWKRAVVYLLLVGVVVAPWITRNWIQMGSPVLVTSNGFNYAALYSPPAQERGAFIDPTRDPYFDGRRLDQFDEVLWSKNLQKTALDNIRQHPLLVPRVMVRNAAAVFEIKPSFNMMAEQMDGRHMGFRSATFWVVWPLTALAVWGAIRNRSAPVVLLATLLGLYFLFGSLVFVAPPRLRAPVELMSIISASSLVRSPERSRPTSQVTSTART